MKRIKQLHSLSQEHHLSLVLSMQSIKTAQSQDSEAIAILCTQIKSSFDERWEVHFQKEERTIFTIIQDHYLEQITSAQAALVDTLLEQHQQMRHIAKTINPSKPEELQAFGELLKTHTRLEERDLFPFISEMFTEKELKAIESAG